MNGIIAYNEMHDSMDAFATYDEQKWLMAQADATAAAMDAEAAITIQSTFRGYLVRKHQVPVVTKWVAEPKAEKHLRKLKKTLAQIEQLQLQEELNDDQKTKVSLKPKIQKELASLKKKEKKRKQKAAANPIQAAKAAEAEKRRLADEAAFQHAINEAAEEAAEKAAEEAAEKAAEEAAEKAAEKAAELSADHDRPAWVRHELAACMSQMRKAQNDERNYKNVIQGGRVQSARKTDYEVLLKQRRSTIEECKKNVDCLKFGSCCSNPNCETPEVRHPVEWRSQYDNPEWMCATCYSGGPPQQRKCNCCNQNFETPFIGPNPTCPKCYNDTQKRVRECSNCNTEFETSYGGPKATCPGCFKGQFAAQGRLRRARQDTSKEKRETRERTCSSNGCGKVFTTNYLGTGDAFCRDHFMQSKARR